MQILEELAIAQIEYAGVIGSLIYATHCTILDISFAIGRILGYLERTNDLGIFYSDYPAVLEGYSDASWNY